MRMPKPWFRESKQTWYATVGGRKVSLGVKGEENEADAVQAWHRLMADGTAKAPQTAAVPAPVPVPTVKAVVNAFLADAEGRLKAGTVEVYRAILLPFAKAHGTGSNSRSPEI